MNKQSIDCLLLPGLHGSGELYSPLIKQLDKRAAKNELLFNYTAIQYPNDIKQGYRSLSDWTEKKVNLVGSDKKVVIIAESFSTPIALRLANRFPENVSAVIIASGFCASPVNMSFALLPLRPLFMISPPLAAIRHFLLGNDVKKEKLKELRAILNSIPSRVLSRRLRSVLTLEEANMPTIADTPLLLLQAQHDGLIPWEVQNQLESHFPHSETHWVDSPHLLFQSRPKVAAKHIVEFLRKIG